MRETTSAEPNSATPDSTTSPGETAPAPVAPAGEQESTAAKLDGEPTRTADFWSCGAGIAALDDPSPVGRENALQKLGKPPFERTTRTRFRILGYLATVYEHVSSDLGKDPNGET